MWLWFLGVATLATVTIYRPNRFTTGISLYTGQMKHNKNYSGDKHWHEMKRVQRTIFKKMISVKRERWQILESYCESGRYVSMSITSQRFVVSLQKLRMLEMNTKNDQKKMKQSNSTPFFNPSPFLRTYFNIPSYSPGQRTSAPSWGSSSDPRTFLETWPGSETSISVSLKQVGLNNVD
jgi:hypothetical protein